MLRSKRLTELLYHAAVWCLSIYEYIFLYGVVLSSELFTFSSGTKPGSRVAAGVTAAEEPTFAERLGWPKGSRVLMIHADDAGMSKGSNEAIIGTIQAGTVTSASVMIQNFPCQSKLANKFSTGPSPQFSPDTQINAV